MTATADYSDGKVPKNETAFPLCSAIIIIQVVHEVHDQHTHKSRKTYNINKNKIIKSRAPYHNSSQQVTNQQSTVYGG